MKKKPSKKQIRQAEEFSEAFGNMHVLSVGVSDYEIASGLQKLKKCSDDALYVSKAFAETPQLHADKDFIVTLTSETVQKPSRGRIIMQLKKLAGEARVEERILFFFSGHGHRIEGDDDFYLVPEDAFSCSEPTALISFSQVIDILTRSDAKQKIVVLDACLSGPRFLGTKASTKASRNYIKEHVADTQGLVILSSCQTDEKSYEKSRHDKLSLFTSIFVNALEGAPEALDNQYLTISSLFDFVSTGVKRLARSMQLEQTPTIVQKSNGEIFLGDFTPSLITTGSVDFSEHPLSSITLNDSFTAGLDEILTEYRGGWKAEGVLQAAAESALPNYLKGYYKKLRSPIRKAFKYSVDDIEVDEASLLFPGGSLYCEVEVLSKHSARLDCYLDLEIEWFERPEDVLKLLDALDLSPRSIVWNLRGIQLVPLEQIASFEAKGWETDEEDEDSVSFSRDRIEMTVFKSKIHINGFKIKDLLLSPEEGNKTSELITETLQLVADQS